MLSDCTVIKGSTEIHVNMLVVLLHTAGVLISSSRYHGVTEKNTTCIHKDHKDKNSSP